MLIKLLLSLSICLLTCTSTSNVKKAAKLSQDQPTDCTKCYFMGYAYSEGGYSPSGTQQCVNSPNGKGAVWMNMVNNPSGFVPAATCMYCQSAGLWYSEGACPGTTSPPQYCTGGQWK